MSDAFKPPDPSRPTPTEPAAPARTTPRAQPTIAPAATPSRTRTGSHPLKVMSAARVQPLAVKDARPIGERLRAGLADTGLNALSYGRQLWTDFRRADKFFKWKALIIVGWVALSGTSFVVACPGSGGVSNALGAKLVRSGTPDEPILMIKNTSDEPWKAVFVTANRRYSLGLQLLGPGKDLVFTPRDLRDEGGEVPPKDLLITDLELRTEDGRTILLEQGTSP